MAKILVVDDNPDFLRMQQLLLRQEGHDVRTAVNGLDALQQSRRDAFDLVITDLIMPEKEGFEVIMELRREQPETRIIAISGGGRVSANDYLPVAKALGASRTLAKPVSGEDLLAVVHAVLRLRSE